MNISKSNFTSIELMREQLLHKIPQNTKQTQEETKVPFNKILEQRQQDFTDTKNDLKRSNVEHELRFSKHANERLISRNIDLSNEQIARLENGANKAREKGIKDTLVMVDDLAFIVNVKNNTVVTAVNETEDTVFTNIDGAVIS